MDVERQIFAQRIQPKIDQMFYKRQKGVCTADQTTPLIYPLRQPVKKRLLKTEVTIPELDRKSWLKLDKHEPEWSWWHYYKRQRKSSTATCRLCGWTIGRGAGLSDLLLANHMQNTHPHHHCNRLRAEGCQTLKQLVAHVSAPLFLVTVDRVRECLCIEVNNLSNEVVQIPIQLSPASANSQSQLDEASVRCQLDNLLNELQIPKCRVRFGEQLK